MNKAIRKGLEAMQVLCFFAAIIYFIGSVGAYENGAINEVKLLLRIGVSALMICLL